MQKKILVCFTASYPYGTKETFFENELPYLANAFEQVYIIPKYNPSNSNKKRPVPENVGVYSPCASSNKIKRIVEGIFNLSPFGAYLQDFFAEGVYKSAHNAAKWFNSMIVYRLMYAKLRTKLQGLDGDLILYSYWAEAPLFVSKAFKKYKKIVRMHRSDFYLEVNRGYLPLRQKIYDNTDLLLPISLEIQTILRDFYNIPQEKIFLNYLGVNNSHGRQPLEISESVIRIVSCSRVDPIKRVKLIAKALSKYTGSKIIEWHHFGDGTVFDSLKMFVNDNLKIKNVKVMLHGWASQETIYNFYKDNEVTWFINVSLHEGVPVSIMEAQSYGVPAIATNVGASAEIVNDENGVLLESKFELEQLLYNITNVYNEEYLRKRERAYITWNKKFVASRNYTQLVSKIRTFFYA
ncbi:glycosyltransferase [Olivibacter jilunii]|uniref:glycosyltransferase n=1 Tax=Olivibacter jilunii TaxID=985016 RepID=UPI003F151677